MTSSKLCHRMTSQLLSSLFSSWVREVRCSRNKEQTCKNLQSTYEMHHKYHNSEGCFHRVSVDALFLNNDPRGRSLRPFRFQSDDSASSWHRRKFKWHPKQALRTTRCRGSGTKKRNKLANQGLLCSKDHSTKQPPQCKHKRRLHS